ncbi:Glycosyltransferase involved in cell wall bisynthesis [Alteromonadaceae bacterium Bs31]|nr:Glycosyltransferase involved in cell wall bisynthesis [Alteromonadaceae bacterium Bs31]
MTGSHTDIKSIVLIGNYLPRRCGIATFTADLEQALSGHSTDYECWAVAMNDRPEGYAYPDKIRFEINQKLLRDYSLAAEFLNINNVDVVCVQHEYGIFGGPAGSHILKLLADLRKPIVTTLHTVLAEPEDEYRAVMMRLAGLSDRLIVMSQKAIDLLQTVYGIDPRKICYIPHGIPDMPFVDPSYYKEKFGVLGKKMLLTFGLLSQNKGIEYALQALPRVIEQFPDIAYIVLGATHPQVLKNEGEAYRLGLQQQVQKLHLEKHVFFQNRFVSLKELTEYLSAADIYITPYDDPAQITSGTLAYAMGTGKPVVSTPYWYAEEMLAEGRGKLVPFKDADAMGDALIDLLANDEKRHSIRKNAYDYCRDAVWEKVAERYLAVFDEVKVERSRKPRPQHSSSACFAETVISQELPILKLDHLLAMTDDVGVLQHAKYAIPDRNHGYCTDDNARALIVAAEAHNLLVEPPQRYELLCDRYLAFLLHAFNPESGRFRNFMGYDRRWQEAVGSEDSHGRALWSLGAAVNLLKDSRQLPMLFTLFKQALPAVEALIPLRSMAFSLVGIHAYLVAVPGDSEARRACGILAERIYKAFQDNATQDWPWPESMLTYDNARLTQALILGGQVMQNAAMSEMGLRSLSWLFSIQSEKGHFVPIGNNGWYRRGEAKARFAQQPLEPQGMIDACIAAYEYSQDKEWLHRTMIAFNWFLGHNDLNLPLYDAKTGGCRDGLESDGANGNQGAESSLAWLMSLARLHRFSASQVLVSKAPKNKVMAEV